ncbi:MAG TPA: ABC transporter ATP-binding protein [Bacillota bacterium]|nr:ABC transporter ATP-binding protein [Bacillota bacterium]
MLQLTRFLRPYRWFVAMVLVLTFAQTMSSLYLPNLMSDIVDTGIIQSNQGYILRIGGFMLLIALLGGLASVLASLYGAKATAGFGQLLRIRLFTHVQNYSLREFDQWGTSSLIVRTTNDVMQVQQLVGMMLRLLVMAPLTAIGGIILAVRTDARLSVIIVVILPVMALAIYAVMGPGLGLFRLLQTLVDRLNLVLRENLQGARVVRSFGRTPHELGRFDAANRNLTDTSVAVMQLMATLMPLMMLIMSLSTVAIVWFGGIQIDHSTLQIGQLMAFIQYVTQIMFAVMMGSMLFFMFPRGQASALRINEVLALDPQVKGPVQPRALPEAKRGHVEFDHVTFHYPGGQAPALSDISFTLAPGEITAIIGGTGSGKSTLLNLMLRFFDVSSGSVRIDGVDLREMSLQDLRSRIGYAPQLAVLFTGSILDNLRFGDRTLSEEAARHAAAVAQATEFIDELGQGMQSVIDQGGTNLSGGQRQRLAIARALARRAEIYLFDDSFSALDYRTDARLRAALRPEVAAATTVIVAQRVSTVMQADRILVLDDGRLVGSGTHQELLASCSVYQEIVASQLTPEDVG